MKKILISSFCIALLISCGKDNPVSNTMEKVKETKEKVKDAKEAVSNVSKIAKESEKIEEIIKELSEKESLSTADFKAWLPDEIKGLKRSSFKSGEMSTLGVSSVEASYKNEDGSQKVDIKITDGAGGMASMVVGGTMMMLSQDFEEENENGYKKIVERNGNRFLEEFSVDKSSIQTLYDNRFLVEIKGENMNPDEIMSIFNDLNLNKLGR